MFRRFFAKFVADRSKYPKLRDEDVSKAFARGSGPGGQSVNKANNAVRLKHEPTGVSVKVHDTRSGEKNLKIAWQRLHDAVDVHLNGEKSVVEQKRRFEAEKERLRKEQRTKQREKKRLEKEEAKKCLEEPED